jgi:hypothetical protein
MSMLIRISFFAASMGLLGLAAQADEPLRLPSMLVAPTATQCMAAIEEGVFLGQTDSGAMIFWYSGAAYFVRVSPENFECTASRYIQPNP